MYVSPDLSHYVSQYVSPQMSQCMSPYCLTRTARMPVPGRPEAPHDCLVLNQSSESLSVRCLAGFDGGLAQRFVAELREAAGRRLLRNLTQLEPSFSVRHLPAGLRLRLELYAVNARGRSEPVTIDGLTLQAAEKRVSNDAGARAWVARGGGGWSDSSMPCFLKSLFHTRSLAPV